MMRYRRIPAGYEDDDDEDYEDDREHSVTQTTQNLKIRVVPDITAAAGLNGEDFDMSLPSEMNDWFHTYKEHWNSYKRTPLAQENLKRVLLGDSKPLLLGLKFFARSPGCNNIKNKNIALFIIETICNLHKQHPYIAESCDDNTRMVAFNFVKICGIVSLYKAVMEAYELYKIRELLIGKVKELIEKGYYRDAAYWAMNLEITHIFSIFDIVFPLILQDKTFLAEEYLDIAKEQQLQIVQFLDSLVDKRKAVTGHCYEILAKYKYSDIKHNILSHRPMSKLITRFIKKYKIAAHLTPNLNFSKTCSYLRYLHHKYEDGSMSCESYRELVRDTANTKELQIDVVENITLRNDVKEAVYWAKYFQLSPNDCPSSIKAKLLQNTDDVGDTYRPIADTVDAAELAYDDNADSDIGAVGNYSAQQQQKEFLILQLPADCIILVDTKRSFLEMMSYLEGHALVAFDSEWKPSAHSETISLIQLATCERVYLIDCLSPQLTEDLWRLLGRDIFNNLEILKIGFAVTHDLRMLQKSLPLQLNVKSTSAYLDLHELWRRLKFMQIINFPYGTCSGESLSNLAEVCLGKKLDKSNQCSNWANRPLRHDQIVYAALDAHCLTSIYKVMAEIVCRMGFDIDQVVDEITTAKTGYLFHMKRIVSSQNNSSVAVCETASNNWGVFSNNKTQSKSEEDTKLLCDSTLRGLSRELRKLGIDVVDIETPELDLSDYINLAKRENRYVLCSVASYNQFAGELPKQCIEITADTILEQVLKVINYFSIKLDERNFFTRCLSCNNNEFIFVHKTEMQLMRYGQVLDDKHSKESPTFLCDKPLNLVHVNDHILRTKTTFRGKHIKLNKIKNGILRNKKYFLICDNCGICTWDGADALDDSIMRAISSSIA